MKETALGLLIPESTDPPNGPAQIGGNAEKADALIQVAGGAGGSIYAAEVTRTSTSLGSFSTPLKIPIGRIRAKQALEIFVFGWASGSINSLQTPETQGAYFGLSLGGSLIAGGEEIRLASEKHDIAANSFRQIGTYINRFRIFHPEGGTTNTETDYKIGESQATLERPGLGSISPFARPMLYVVNAEMKNTYLELVGKMLASGTVKLTNIFVMARPVG